MPVQLTFRITCVLVGWTLMISAVHAQTLQQVLEAAYRTSPRLDAERARLRATNEEVPRAYAGFKPALSAETYAEARRRATRPRGDSDGPVRPGGASLSLTQPIFSGWRTVAQVHEAEATVSSSREQLRLVEQIVLLEAAAAYFDVVRDRAVVQLRERQLTVLERVTANVEARLVAQEVTKTDVAQARSRRARGAAALDLARGALKRSEAAFERSVGAPPQSLSSQDFISRVLPMSKQEAHAIAAKEHPLIIGALYREQAARHTVDRIRGELLPEVRLEAEYTRDIDSDRETELVDVASVKGRLIIPLYSGGEVQARVRQASHARVGRLEDIEQSRIDVRAEVDATWAQHTAAKAAQENILTQLLASRSALAGVREELTASARTVIEVLNAEQEVVDAEIANEQARREAMVAAFAIVAATGRLTIEYIGTSLPVYDSTTAGDWERNWVITEIAASPAPAGRADKWPASAALRKNQPKRLPAGERPQNAALRGRLE